MIVGWWVLLRGSGTGGSGLNGNCSSYMVFVGLAMVCGSGGGDDSQIVAMVIE